MCNGVFWAECMLSEWDFVETSTCFFPCPGWKRVNKNPSNFKKFWQSWKEENTLKNVTFNLAILAKLWFFLRHMLLYYEEETIKNCLLPILFMLNKLHVVCLSFIDGPVCDALFCWLSAWRQFSFQRISKTVWNMWSARERHLVTVWESQVNFRKVNKNINSLVAVFL